MKDALNELEPSACRTHEALTLRHSCARRMLPLPRTLQYGNRASKALISTEEENYLRTFEAQAETFASAPSVFITGGLLLFGHFQPVAGQTIAHTKVVIDIVVQLITNFVADWVSLSSIDRSPSLLKRWFGFLGITSAH